MHVWLLEIPNGLAVRTKVFGEEPHRSEVDYGGGNFTHHHVRVPGGDLERNHDELVENERRERDGNNV